MAQHSLLAKVDYLSTVSGGGYIGAWLLGWIKRHGGVCAVSEDLKKEADHAVCRSPVLAFLRDYSSYLTPRNGLLTADAWTAATTWIRNTLLNLFVLLSAIAAVLIVPRLPQALMEATGNWLRNRGHVWEEGLTLLAITCQIWIIVRVAKNLNAFADHGSALKDGQSFGDPIGKIQLFIILPALASAWLCAARLWAIAREAPPDPVHFIGIAAMVFACLFLLWYLQVKSGYVKCYMRDARQTGLNRNMARSLCALLPLITASVKVAVLLGIYSLFKQWIRTQGVAGAGTLVAVCGVPMILGDFALCITVHIGLMGRYLPDNRREWWSRVAAYLAIYAVGVWALVAVCYYGPSIRFSIPWTAATLFWAGITVAGLLVASLRSRSKKTAGITPSDVVVRMVVTMAPHVFMAGLLIAVSIGVSKLLVVCKAAFAAAPNPLVELALFLVLASIAYFLARAVDVNEFSMHHFYRNRLVRTYLGASRCEDRTPNRLTGFDGHDDLLLATLRPECEPGVEEAGLKYDGPYPIFNAALNLVDGEKLSWQERKATSFSFTPKFCGYEYIPDKRTDSNPNLCNAGYRPTAAYAYPDGGVNVGTAMAISGAATSPNAGLYTNTSMAFLLTVFNVRLGWWMGNPRHHESWRRAGPSQGLGYLATELFGRANDQRKHVYLSDGGHFENLGIYELVRRRCSLIIACDAEEDHELSFAGLGSAIRKCAVDFGVEIDIDLTDVRPAPGKRASARHWVTGRIYYPENWIGTLIYVKASLTGDEPADLQAYLAKHECFPHQSTTEQFFEESEFESYRRLGLHISGEVFKCQEFQQSWVQAMEASAQTSTAHA